MPFTSKELRQKYDQSAPKYDWLEGILELLGVWRLRQQLLEKASGKVLEVAAGTGKNLPYYPVGCKLSGVDLSFEMLKIARRKAGSLNRHVPFAVMDAEALGLRDRVFDTVVSSFTVCTFPRPVAALREMARVCKPDGRILLLEHGRSDREWLGRWQDRRADKHARFLGCHWNREPQELAREAGLKSFTATRTFFGIFHVMEARP